jgi:hypothetical protein
LQQKVGELGYVVAINVSKTGSDSIAAKPSFAGCCGPVCRE